MLKQTGDEALVARALAGRDTSAYGELVRRYQSQIRGWLRQLTRDPALADDIAQETFIRAWHKLDTYSGKGRFPAWLMKIAHNEFLQALRRSRAVPPAGPGLPPESPLPDEYAGEFTDVRRFLAVLGRDERSVMVLVHGYGLSHGEASEVTGLPLGTVKSHIRRGTAKIRAQFDLPRSAGQERSGTP